MVSRRLTKRAFVGAVATSLAALAMMSTAATAFADDTADADKPIPGTAIPRNSDRGYANAGPSTVLFAPRGTAWGSRNVSPAAPNIVISDGNPTTLCFANSAFDAATCGLGS